MALNNDQKKRLDQFMKNTPSRVREYGGGTRSLLDDDLLGQIEIALNTGILQKYVYQKLGIPEQTWEGWKKKGREFLKRLDDTEDPFQWEDLKLQDQRYVYFAAIIEMSKATVVTATWQNMRELSKTNFKAGEFILRTLGKQDFLHADHYIHHGVGEGGNRDEEIEKELAGFLPKTLEELEDDEDNNP